MRYCFSSVGMIGMENLKQHFKKRRGEEKRKERKWKRRGCDKPNSPSSTFSRRSDYFFTFIIIVLNNSLITESTQFLVLQALTLHSCKFTCYKEFGRSVVDYLIVSENHIDKIDYFALSTKKVDSDHVGLCFALSIHPVKEKNQKNRDCLYHEVYKWDPAKKDQYIQTFHDVNTLGDFDSMLCAVPNQPTADEFCKFFYIFLEGAIQKVSKKRAVKTTCTFPNNPWFDDDCKQMKSSINDNASSHDITEASQGLI